MRTILLLHHPHIEINIGIYEKKTVKNPLEKLEMLQNNFFVEDNYILTLSDKQGLQYNMRSALRGIFRRRIVEDLILSGKTFLLKLNASLSHSSF